MVNSLQSQSNPKHDNERLILVDALRGFALMGVCFVHMLEQYYAGPLPETASTLAYSGVADKAIGGINFIFFVGKFYLLFSLLFGVSFFIQMNNAAEKANAFEGKFLWRLVLLFGFGIIHHYFYRGDILTTYATLGVLLLVLNRVSTKMLLSIAIVLFLGAGKVASLLVWDGGGPFGNLNFDPASPENLEYFQAIKYGGIIDVFNANHPYTISETANFQYAVFGRGYITLALFIIGICLGRLGFFHSIEHHKATIKRVLKYSVGASIVFFGLTFGLFSLIPQPPDFSTPLAAVALMFMDLFNLSLSLLFACSFLLITVNQKEGKLVSIIAPYGRMALTNYLLQAVIGTAIFYGWGLGLIGEVSNLDILPIAIAVITAQLYFSKAWMKKFNYGPLEWLWRSVTERRFCTLRKRSL